MTSVEQTGKTVQDATDKALKELGVTEDEVNVEIIEEGARGFLGIGQASSRVRVTLKRKPAEQPAAPPEPRPERSRPPRQSRERAPRPAPEPRQKPAPPEQRPAPAPRPPREQRADRPAPAPPAEQRAPSEPPTEETMRAAAELSVATLKRIVDSIEDGAEAKVKSSQDGQLVLEVRSGDPAAIIGRHGQTIDAIQYLVGVTTNMRMPEKVRIVVDVEGYRERREEDLRAQAVSLAEQVKGSGEEAVFGPLPPNDRRIMHTALADDPDVYTYSEGEEPERCVVISPKK